MKKTTALLLLVPTLTLAAACSSAPTANRPPDANARATSTTATPAAPAASPAAPADELAAARNTYMQFCTRCHRPDGSGGPFEIDDGKKLDVPTLREGRVLKETDEEFAEQIMNGGDGMPAFKNRLDPERVNGLVRFIRQEFQGKASSGGAAATNSGGGNVNKPMPAPAH